MFYRKRKRQEGPRYSYKGERVVILQNCVPHCPLMPDEEENWNKLKQFLEGKPYKILCTFRGWDNFLNRTILTGNIPQFMNHMEKVAKRCPNDLYHLTDGGKINTVTVVKDER
ncbi:MAG: hypothetical protein IJ629_03345 [Clostridia bacterium]|nr:hypothetical protein [Clostridia bacterium]